MVELSKRESMKKELLAKCQDILSKRESFPVFAKLPNGTQWQKVDEKTCQMISVSQFNIDLSCRRFAKLLTNWNDHINKFDNIHTCQMLSSEEGYPIVHQRICPPVPLVSSRSMYHCLYHGKEGEEIVPLGGAIPEDENKRLDRGYTYLVSTSGNEMWEEMFADAITGDDVVSKLDYDYIEVRPIMSEEGEPLPGCCSVLQVIQCDPCGMLPQILKNKLSEDCVNSCPRKVKYIKDNNLWSED